MKRYIILENEWKFWTKIVPNNKGQNCLKNFSHICNINSTVGHLISSSSKRCRNCGVTIPNHLLILNNLKEY